MILDKERYHEKYSTFTKISFWDFRRQFLILYGIPEVREASRNLPGARGFALIEYEPVATHDDPIQAQNYQIPAAQKCRDP